MNWGEIWVVFEREGRDLLKDRRALILTAILPILLYPVIMFGVTRLAHTQEQKLEAREFAVVLTGDRAVGRKLVLDSGGAFNVILANDPEQAVRSGEAALWLHVPPGILADPAAYPAVFIIADQAEDLSRAAQAVMTDHLRTAADSLSRQRLQVLPASLTNGLVVLSQTENVASEKSMSGATLGRFLPLLIIMMILSGASFVAIDSVAGEKERGTLETLLIAPVARSSIIMGKFSIVVVSAMVSALANMGSLYLTIRLGLSRDTFIAGFQLQLGLADLGIILLLCFPVALLFSSVLLIVSAHARSFKEGQHLVMPLTFASMAPALASALPNLRLDSVLAFVPIANLSLAISEIMSGDYNWPWLLIAFVTNLCFAAVALRAATRVVAKESVLFRGSVQPGWRRRLGDWRKEILILFAIEWLLFFYLGSALQSWHLIGGLLISEWVLLLVPAFLFLMFYGERIGPTLRLQVPTPRNLAGTLLFWVGGFFLAGAAATWQQSFLPMPEEALRGLEQAFSLDGIHWTLRLFAFAITPGICEEILFRGVMANFLARYSRPLAVSLMVGSLFGVFHFSVYRAIPTGVLGVLLTLLYLRTGNLTLPMLMHALQNGLAVSLNEAPLEHIFGAVWTVPVMAAAFALAWPLLHDQRKKEPL